MRDREFAAARLHLGVTVASYTGRPASRLYGICEACPEDSCPTCAPQIVPGEPFHEDAAEGARREPARRANT